MPGAVEIKVKGARELELAFLDLRREVLAEMKPELIRTGEKVRVDAEINAWREITNIGSSWMQMRLGVTVNGVYVAPKSRRRGGSPRPNMAGLLMERAMQPALDSHEDEIVRDFEVLVDASAAKAGFF